ncbi:MAG TPA: GGDEF domain-containing protein [Pseudomonadales bacterium]|nr:GGDEF domain-containing protein [Pseudomonadales bacterium]
MTGGKELARLFDRMVNSGYLNDQETLYKARILAGIVSMYIMLMLVTCGYILFFAPLSGGNIAVSMALLLTMTGGYLYVLYLLKYSNNYERCISAVIFFTYAGTVFGIATSGGPIDSPATPIMVIPIILAFSLSTRHGGLKWSCIVATTHLLMIAINQWLFRFPQLLDTAYMTMHHLMHWVVTYFAIIFLMLIFESITHRLKQERDAERDRYAYLAAHDPLTGLANRSMFDSQLTRALANCDRNHNIVGLMMIDLDGFKPVNDQYGHDAGDLVLRTISERLQILLRKTDTIARMGGDEFAVILENVITPPGVDIVAGRVIAEINKPYEGLPASVKIGASVGVAMYPGHTSDEEKLRVFADRAMYVAKKEHNCYRVFSPEMEFIAN